MKLRDGRIQRDRPADILNRNVIPSVLLMGEHTEQMQHVRMLRLGLQDLPVERLGLPQAAGLWRCTARLKASGIVATYFWLSHQRRQIVR